MHKNQDVNSSLHRTKEEKRLYNASIIDTSNKDVETHNFGSFGATDSVNIAKYINSSIIGNKTYFEGPYGRCRIVYCDHIASGRSVEFIENFLR